MPIDENTAKVITEPLPDEQPTLAAAAEVRNVAAQNQPAQPARQVPTPEQQLDFFLGSIANHNLRGMVAITTQFPPEVALPAIARNYAMVLSHMTSAGDLGAILRVRGAMKKAFEEGIGKFPIQPAPPPPPTGGSQIRSALLNGGMKTE